MKNTTSKKIFSYSLFFPLIIVAAILFFFLDPFAAPDLRAEKDGAEMMMGRITSILDHYDAVQVVEVEITKGRLEGEKIVLTNDESIVTDPRVFYEKDKVMIAHLPDPEGEEFEHEGYFYIAEYDRSTTIFVLFGLFTLVVVAVASWQGIGALAGLGVSFVVIFRYILPQILSGAPPVTTAIIGAIFIIPVIFYFSHGFQRKTTVAVLGTILTLIVTGVIATFFAKWTNLTGLASAEANSLNFETGGVIDFRGLVLAGMIISILGIMNDITVSQASIVQQLKQVKEKISFGELYFRAMKVGRDHIASMVNTLILVYTGVSLPILLLFMDRAKWFREVINYEFLTEEIVRTMVGSIGLILAVPITTFLAAMFLKKEDRD